MSVMACGRAGCENIMCKNSIFDGEMYICNECLSELLLLQKRTMKAARKFMRLPKGKERSLEDFKQLIGLWENEDG